MNFKKSILTTVSILAAISTASIAQEANQAPKVMVGGSIDWRFVNDKMTRDRTQFYVKANSEDGAGAVNVGVRYQRGVSSLYNASIKYTTHAGTFLLGAVQHGLGRFSDDLGRALFYSKALGNTKLHIGLQTDNDGKNKQLIAVAGKHSMINYFLDYQIGEAKQYVAFLGHLKLGMAKLGAGYAIDSIDSDRSILGLSAGIGLDATNISAGFISAGANGADRVVEAWQMDVPDEYGVFYGSQDPSATTFYARASTKHMNTLMGAFFAAAGEKSSYRVYAHRPINTQVKLKAWYTDEMSDQGSNKMIEIRLASKF